MPPFDSRSLFEDNPNAIIVFDRRTRELLAVNDAACRHFGYTREELLGRDVSTLRPPEDVGPMLSAYAESLSKPIEGPMPFPGGVWRHLRKDGSIVFVELWRIRLDFEGRPASMVVIWDVTARVRLEEQLRQSQKMEATGLLAGGIAHDFNNLLGVVLGATELARRAARSGLPVDGPLDEIEVAAMRAAELTRKLLAFSRKQVLHSVPLDLDKTVEEFLTLLRRVIGEDVELELQHTGGPLVVTADATQLEQVLLNLVTNARQAMPSGGRLTIRTGRTRFDEADVALRPWAAVGDYAELTVSDSGIGMDPQTLERACEPFFTTRSGGTGLGLAMVHGIVHQHHGLLRIESRLGEGTNVGVFLPIAPERPAPSDRPPPRTQVRGGRETILVAEDEPVLQRMLARTLRDLGYTVVVAADGEEAARLFEASHDAIDLVVLDVVMPKLGGLEACARMRAIAPSLKVIFTTGHAPDSAQVGELVTRGGHGLLTKPFTLDALGQKVREVLDAPS